MDISLISLILFQVLILSMISWYIIFHIRRKRLYELAEEFEGPKALPFIGNALKCWIPLHEMPRVMLESGTYYKSPAKLWFGPHLLLCVWDPESVKIILNSPHALEKPRYVYSIMESIIGRGLDTLPVNEWKRHRRLISPNFNQYGLKNAFVMMRKQADSLVKNLRTEEGRGNFDVDGYAAECGMKSAMEFLLGINMDESLTMNTQELAKLFGNLLEGLVAKASNVLYFSDFIFRMSPIGRKWVRDNNRIKSIIYSIIEHWKNLSLTMGDQKKGITEKSETAKPKTFIQHLLSTSDELGKLTEQELQEEVNTFILASLDTTATLMGYLLMTLGMHPEIQERVFQEIEQVLGEREIQYNNLKSFVYTARVVKETLRIFPLLGGFARYTTQEIPLGNRTIPAGTTVAIGLLNLHRDPKVWPNPTKFDPDRFLPEEEAKRHHYAWIPFSAGPRNCIGLKFAFMNLMVMTTNIVKNFKITTPYKNIEDVHIKMHFILRPSNGFKISIMPRQRGDVK